MNAIVLLSILSLINDSFRGRAVLQLELLALRHQLATLKRISPRPLVRPPDQLLWVILSRILPNRREVLIIVKPETVVDGVADVGQEGRALLGGGDHELAIEGGQEALLDIAVGLIDGGDGGQAQFLG